MADSAILDLTDRVRVLERELEELRSQVTGTNGANQDWVESVSGSMKEFPEDVYNKIIETGRAIITGETEVKEEL